MRFAVDNDRAFSIDIDIDGTGRIWHFVRDVANGRMVIDVFSREGRFLRSHSYPLENAPAKIDRQGRSYSISSRAGFPQLIRYRGIVTGGCEAGRRAMLGGLLSGLGGPGDRRIADSGLEKGDRARFSGVATA